MPRPSIEKTLSPQDLLDTCKSYGIEFNSAAFDLFKGKFSKEQKLYLEKKVVLSRQLAKHEIPNNLPPFVKNFF